ncbi:MAG: hypothetical protein IJ176_04475 [Prevotella sp.]|nr:hypothetical protein [Prevotella sp.]
MKKLKLFIAAAALVLGGGMTASAADLPTSGSGEYFVKNVGTGTYLKGDAYYGTKVVVWNDPYAVTITAVDGKYTIMTQQNNGGQNQYITAVEDPYVDGAVCQMTITEVDATNHYFTINNGTGNLYATEVTEDGAKLYKVMAGDVATDFAKWQFISRAELVAALDEASSSNPVDATFFMKDAGIDVKSVNASSWTISNVDLGGGGNAGHSGESWNKSAFSISQKVEGLPNGKYRATCYGYYRWNNGGTNSNAAAVAAHADGTEVLNAIFFAGGKDTPLMSVAGDANATAFCSSMGWADNTPNNQWQAAACFTQGFYLNAIEDIVVSDGTLTIGVKKDTQAGTDWCVFDEFKLYYLGEDISIYETPLAEAKAAAAAVDQTAQMNASVLAALQNAIATYGGKEFATFTSVDEITEAISALNTATTNATSSINNYAAALAILNAANSLDAAGQASYAANETVTAIKTVYEAKTLEAVTAEQKAACEAALRAAAKAQTTAGADMTLAINNWDFLNCANNNFPGWNISAPNGGNTWTHGSTCVEYWIGTAANGSFDYYQELADMPIGKYTVQASMWNSANNEEGAAVNGAAGVYGTSGEMTVFAGVDTESNDGSLVTKTTDEISVLDGTLRIGVKNNATMGARWFGVDWIKLTFVEAIPEADADDYAALNSAIAAAEAKTLGFEADEYAPYNNVAALETLAAAKAIDQTAANAESLITDATAALTAATWTANTADVECVYNGNFAIGQGSSYTDIQKYGWNRTNGWGQFQNGAEGDDTNGTVYYNQPGSMEYGNAGVYTMPLKANTIYTLTFKYASWATDSNDGMTASVLNGEQGMAAIAYEANDTEYKAANSLVTKTIKFVTGEAGNYVLKLANSGNTVITGVSITKDASQVLEFADGAVPTYAPGTYPAVKITRSLTAGKWATAIYPFAVSGVDKMATLDSYEGTTLNFTSITESTPNEPFLMRSESDKSSIELSNVAVVAAEAKDVVKGNASLKGVYAETTVNAAEGVTNYVLSSNVIYPVGANAAMVAPYRAYIQVSESAARSLKFVVDGSESTGIEGVAAADAESTRVYNLNGQQVKSAQKGIFIQNGKKVVMK